MRSLEAGTIGKVGTSVVDCAAPGVTVDLGWGLERERERERKKATILFSFRAGRLTPDSRDDEARERAVMVKNAQGLLCALNG